MKPKWWEWEKACIEQTATRHTDGKYSVLIPALIQRHFWAYMLQTHIYLDKLEVKVKDSH